MSLYPRFLVLLNFFLYLQLAVLEKKREFRSYKGISFECLILYSLITMYLSYIITFIYVETYKGLLERGGSVVHVLQNRNQKGMYVHVCAASILDEGMCMASPRRAPYSPRHLEGGSLPHLAFPP